MPLAPPETVSSFAIRIVGRSGSRLLVWWFAGSNSCAIGLLCDWLLRSICFLSSVPALTATWQVLTYVCDRLMWLNQKNLFSNRKEILLNWMKSSYRIEKVLPTKVRSGSLLDRRREYSDYANGLLARRKKFFKFHKCVSRNEKTVFSNLKNTIENMKIFLIFDSAGVRTQTFIN